MRQLVLDFGYAEGLDVGSGVDRGVGGGGGRAQEAGYLTILMIAPESRTQ